MATKEAVPQTTNGTCEKHTTSGDFYKCHFLEDALTVFVVGASGDLAKKKTYPSLFALYKAGYLPEVLTICGYARSKMTDDEFRAMMKPKLGKKGEEEIVDRFLECCVYRPGGYDDVERVSEIASELSEREGAAKNHVANRLFYLAIPPNLFLTIGRALDSAARSSTGWNRFIIEKPFGRDLQSFEELNKAIGSLLHESETFRIDHYIGKEMFQNLLVLRFGNAIFEPLWNRNYISTVTITFKEPFGTAGRGGYFDKYGIVRDVMQNHLLQVLTMVAMEPPVRPTGDYIRDEKVKVLEAMDVIRSDECITGQYVEDDEGKEPAYTADEGVPDDSKTPTYAAFVIRINNPRWEGTKFILRAGKALNERKSEIRIQFKQPPGTGHLFPNTESGTFPRNELVLRLQPDEAVYMKTVVKSPGLAGDPVVSTLDLSYKSQFPDLFSTLPDAYTRLILQVLRGDSSAFVRDDELRAAWKIFTPLLHDIDEGLINPIKYKAFSRGPEEYDELARKHGFEYLGEDYKWQQSNL